MANPQSNPLWAPDRGDIIWINFSPQSGGEIANEHPLLVMSSKLFNEKTRLVIGFPMSSSAQMNADNPFAITVPSREGDKYIICSQPKSLDWRARCARPHPWKSVPRTLVEEAKALLNDCI